jgi:hypothetical protein
MTTRFIVPAVFTCMVMLTSLNGAAQAQSASADQATKFAVAEAPVERAASGDAATQYVDPNRFAMGACTVGPRSGDVFFRCYGLGFTTPNPYLVHCQTRNANDDFSNYSDQFACQVIGTSLLDNGSVWVRIRRMDDGTTASGWGQNLKVNLLVVN